MRVAELVLRAPTRSEAARAFAEEVFHGTFVFVIAPGRIPRRYRRSFLGGFSGGCRVLSLSQSDSI